MACISIALKVLVLGSMVTATSAFARAQSPTGSIAAQNAPSPPKTNGRVVSAAERADWWLAIYRSGLVGLLENITVGDRGFDARARSLDALKAFLDERVFRGPDPGPWATDY